MLTLLYLPIYRRITFNKSRACSVQATIIDYNVTFPLYIPSLGVITVSYTHLDVYKRQVYFLCVLMSMYLCILDVCITCNFM